MKLIIPSPRKRAEIVFLCKRLDMATHAVAKTDISIKVYQNDSSDNYPVHRRWIPTPGKRLEQPGGKFPTVNHNQQCLYKPMRRDEAIGIGRMKFSQETRYPSRNKPKWPELKLLKPKPSLP